MANELPQIEQSLQENVSNAVEGGMPLDTPLYGARGETLKDMVDVKEPTQPALDDPIFMEEATYDVDSFLASSQPTVDDFIDTASAPRVIVDTESTNKVVSAKAAALGTEGAALQTYGKVTTDLRDGRTDGLDETMSLLKEKTATQDMNALVQIIQDPSISEEEKTKALDDYNNLQMSELSLNKLVMTESIAADDPGEDYRQEFVRVNTLDAIGEVNDVKRQRQALLNLEAAKSNTETLKAFKDLFVFMLPFTESSYAAQVSLKNDEDVIEVIGNLAFLGEAKQGFKDSIRKMSPDQQIEFAQRLVNAINATEGTLPFEQNDYARLEMLRTGLEEGYYTDFDRFLDNATSILDTTFFGGLLARGFKVGKSLFKVAKNIDHIREARRMSVRGQPDQTSLSQLYKETNVSKAKAAHEAAATDETGEVAQAIYGTDRTTAVANDIMPEVGTTTVKNKVGEPESAYAQSATPSPELMDFVQADGKIHYWRAEKTRMRSKVVNDFESAVGVRNRKEMNQIEATSDGVRIKAVYGTKQFGYDDPELAIETVKVALRDYGVVDKDITLLGRVGDEYVPMTIQEVNALNTVIEKAGKSELKRSKPADFLVQVNHDYKFNPLDNLKWQEASVRGNLFDRIPAFTGNRQGSLSRHLLDAASMLHPKLTLGANIAVDKAAGLERIMLKKGKAFSDGFVKLKAERQAVVHDYVKQANAEGLDLNIKDLKAQGFNDKEIDLLKTWREYWDDMYWLDNRDLARTLNSQNFQWLVDPSTGTQLFARPVPRNKVGSHARVYDPSTGDVRTVTGPELTKLYQEGGTLAMRSTPIKVGDEAVELMEVKNSPGSSYLRRINESDTVLEYRKGYYTVNYTAPKYIDKIVKDSRGNELFRQAVAVAGNTRDAEIMAANLKKTDPVNDYVSRGDIKREGGFENQDGIDVLQARGRTSQRTRGKRLEESTMSENFGDNFVMGPVDSMVLSARTTSNRVATRDYLEATKSRFMSQFGHLLQEDKYGRKLFPTNIKQIEKRGGVYDKDIADARTTFEFIDYLEKGYINGLDESYKAILNTLAEITGKRGMVRTETALRKGAELPGPTNLAKNVSFNLYLASNPLRQAIVQSHQMVQLFAFNPLYAGRKMGGDVSLLLASKLGAKLDDKYLKAFGRTREEYDEMVKAWERSGLSASVDKNSLINGSLTQLLEEQRLKGRSNLLSRSLQWSRKVGFDMGEELNIMTAWLAHRDKLIKSGKKVDDELEDLAAAQARNFTYNMNRAGDMPYNQNFLGMVFQFMQVPHKAMLTWTTNRALSRSEKLRLIGFNATMYSLPPAAMYSWFGDVLPEDSELREVVVQGLEGYMLNKLLSLATGEKTSIDFSGLSPFDVHGLQEFIVSLWTTDVGSILSATPSLSLVFGQNPRITEAARTWTRFFSLQEDTDVQDPVSFSHLVKANASMFSGFSNAFKAKYALETGRKMSINGNITDQDVTTPEAIAALFGFGTMDEANRAWIGQQLYNNSKSLKDDVTLYYTTLKRHLAREGISVKEQEYFVRSFSDAWRVFGNDNMKAREILFDLLKRDAAKGDDLLFKRAMEQVGWKDAKGYRTMIQNIPDQAYSKKQDMLKALDYVDSFKGEQ